VRWVPLKQCLDGRQQERDEHFVGLGQIERPLQGAFGGTPVAEHVPGDRLQGVRRDYPGSQNVRNGVVQHLGELGKGCTRIVLRDPQCRGGDADLRLAADLPGELVQDLPGPCSLAEAHQGVHLLCVPGGRGAAVR